MTRASFEQLVREGMERIPEKFRGYLKDVAVVVEEEPATKHRRTLKRRPAEAEMELLGLYEGTPRTERAYLSYRIPDKITLFQGPLERVCKGDTGRIRKEVSRTIWHELAHALGISEDRLKRLEARRSVTT